MDRLINSNRYKSAPLSFFGNAPRFRKDALASFKFSESQGINGIEFNKRYFKSRAVYKKTITDLRLNNGWLTSTNMSDTLVHEFGHNLDINFGSNAVRKALYDEHKKILNKVSRYAATTPHEAVAELFVIWNKGGDKALKNIKGSDFSQYAKYFAEFIQ